MVSTAGVETTDRPVVSVTPAQAVSTEPGQVEGAGPAPSIAAPASPVTSTSSASSAEGVIDVDFDALAEFMSVFAVLREHVASATQMVSGTSADGLGSFDEAVALAGEHAGFQEEHLARLGRLSQAIDAAETATAQVLANYQATEDTTKSNVDQFVTAIDGAGGAADTAPGMIAGHGPSATTTVQEA